MRKRRPTPFYLRFYRELRNDIAAAVKAMFKGVMILIFSVWGFHYLTNNVTVNPHQPSQSEESFVVRWGTRLKKGYESVEPLVKMVRI